MIRVSLCAVGHVSSKPRASGDDPDESGPQWRAMM